MFQDILLYPLFFSSKNSYYSYLVSYYVYLCLLFHFMFLVHALGTSSPLIWINWKTNHELTRQIIIFGALHETQLLFLKIKFKGFITASTTIPFQWVHSLMILSYLLSLTTSFNELLFFIFTQLKSDLTAVIFTRWNPCRCCKAEELLSILICSTKLSLL